MSRRSVRKNEFYLLFQMDFNDKEEFEEVKEIFFDQQEEPVTEQEKNLILERVEGAKEHLEELDALIGKYAKDWDINRMNKVDLAILRLAIYEMNYVDDVPVGVAINEAVELAKKFSSDEAPSFINGILGKAAESL